MQFCEKDLKEFGQVIERVLSGKNLSSNEAFDVFVNILEEKQPPVNQGAFLAALRAKGETVEEITGCWKAIIEVDTRKVHVNAGKPLVENCGTGMDGIKTFNISTAAAIVSASLGVPMARHGARAITSAMGTVDIAEALGVDVECPVETVGKSIEKCHLGLFNGMSPEVHPGGLFRILKYIRFGSVLNIAASLANPASPSIGVRGVYNDSLLEKIANLLARLGYSRGIVYTGFDGKGEKSMDEISTMGVTKIVEMHNGNTETYLIEPADIGLPLGSYDDVKPLPVLDAEVDEFLKAFTSPSTSRRVDAICANAAPILYVYGKTPTLSKGVEMAREAIESGKALAQLMVWVREQNRYPEKGVKKLEKHLSRLGIK